MEHLAPKELEVEVRMAPLSINHPSPYQLMRGKKGFASQGGGGEVDPSKAYADNLAKLIPGETVALFTLLNQVPPPVGWEQYKVIPFLCCIQLLVFRFYATRSNERGARWTLVIISLLTFSFWVYSNDSWFWTWKPNDIFLYISNISLLTLAFIAPFFIGERS